MDCIKTGDLNRVSVSPSQSLLSVTRSLLTSHSLSVHVQLMELHQQGADFLLQDTAGCTLLHHAVEAGGKEVLKYLIDNGESGVGSEGSRGAAEGRWVLI